MYWNSTTTIKSKWGKKYAALCLHCKNRAAEEKKKTQNQETYVWMGDLDPQISMALQAFADPTDPNTLYSDLRQVAEGYLYNTLLIW